MTRNCRPVVWVLAMGLMCAGCAPRLRPVTLEKVLLVEQPWSLILSSQAQTGTERFVELTLSTDQDLLEFRERWMLQVRCELEGAGAGEEWTTPVWGPFLGEHDLSIGKGSREDVSKMRRADGRLEYRIFVLPHLRASRFTGHEMLPRAIETMEFDALRCRMLGVEYLPMFLLPRTNSWAVSRERLLALFPTGRPGQ